MLTHRAGVVGSPVEHSLSPVLHRAAYDALGLTGWSYDRFRIGGEGELDLPTFVEGLGRDWVGLSVTMPDKEDALALAVAVTEQARRIGAANTLVRREDGWVAANTDPDGVRDALLEAGVGDVRRALVLGSGATARSALDALARLGCRHVGFAVRSRVRPETLDLAEELGVRATAQVEGWEGDVLLDDPAAVSRACAAADVVVSTLPAGAPLGEEAGFDPSADLSRTVLLDAVYADWPTPLARWAEACGATVVPGSAMLLHQAAGQVELMTGHTAPLDAMRRALDDALRNRERCS
ncbi:shikimate dehydrogenase [Mobilicoccus pelagius]|uniref:Shikimate dehydrogenase n=1 Tax=Mobilicoccus pelagius NBRC 104925 TaxID=1089455 RepID=H5UV42_9MICO|nr:shikimate dehydrogenase [Mobilicoccus pelagius]GAB49600.1 shikimate dehydrogenase [Mobilicoccus pelagius NBRC 104925]